MARTMRLTGTGTQLTLAPPEGPSALSLRRGESNWTIGSDDPALFLRIANNDRTAMRISPGGVVWVDRLNVNNNAICRRLPTSEGESYSFDVPDDAFSEISVTGVLLARARVSLAFETRVESSMQLSPVAPNIIERNVDRFRISVLGEANIPFLLKLHSHPGGPQIAQLTFAYCVVDQGHSISIGSFRSLRGSIGTVQLQSEGRFRVTAASLTSQ
jgi:hypothetical protein